LRLQVDQHAALVDPLDVLLLVGEKTTTPLP
jgi:hypothetical protein